MFIHTCIHTYMDPHPFKYTCIHTYIHTYIHTCSENVPYLTNCWKSIRLFSAVILAVGGVCMAIRLGLGLLLLFSVSSLLVEWLSRRWWRDKIGDPSATYIHTYIHTYIQEIFIPIQYIHTEHHGYNIHLNIHTYEIYSIWI